MTRAGFLAGLAAAFFALACAPSPGYAREVGVPATLVELFTSQGCSSCPPADKLAVELSARDDVLPLTMAVDYWDGLGWKDTLASPEWTARQRAWARTLGGSMYTPQMVVDGSEAVVGSQRRAVEAALRRARARAHAEPPPRMTLRRQSRALAHLTIARAEGEPPAKPVRVTMYCYPRAVKVAIERGENAGRSITYANPVRLTQDLGVWTGAGRAYAVNLAEAREAGCEAFAVVVQSRPHAPPLAAARWDINAPRT